MERRKFPILFAIILSVFVFYSCSKSGVEVRSFSPQGEVGQYESFEVLFSQDLAPQEVLGQWLDDEFLEFDPPVPGKFKWISPDMLTFSPDVPLRPSQDYKVKITKKVLFDNKISTNFEKYEFHTPYFDALSAEFFYNKIPHSDYQVVTMFNLNFNYEVDPEDLRDKLRIEVDGKKLSNFTIETDRPSKVIPINMGEQKMKESETNYKVTVESGMKSTEVDYKLPEDREFTYDLPPLTRLAITSVATGFDGGDGWIEVYTTQKVDEDKLKQYLDLTPSGGHSINVSENSFRLSGNFKPGTEVSLTLKKGMPGLYGGVLESDYAEELVMADLSPMLKFSDKNGKYLARSGMKNIGVEAVNVPRVDMEIYEVFANNIIFFHNYASGYYYDDYYYDDYYYEDEGTDHQVGDFGKKLYDETIYLGEFENKLNQFTLNLEDQLQTRFKGIFVVKVRDAENRWRKDSKIIAMSDLGIITKKGKDDLTVFINSITGTDAVEGAKVTLVSTNNQNLLTGTTDAAGVVQFKDLRQQLGDFFPRMIVVEKEDDFNYLDLRSTEVSTSRYEVGGKHEYSVDYEAFLYGDRNLYRPGEAVKLAGIIRDKQFGTVTDLPVILKIITPTGREFKAFTKKLNGEGSFEESIDLPTSAQTGQWKAELWAGTSEVLYALNFSVEEFVPDKIRVRVESEKEKATPDEKVDISIDAEYLFGAAAANSSYEVDVKMDHRSFYSKRYSGYNFWNTTFSNSSIGNDYESGELDSKGHADFSYNIPEVEGEGYLKATAYVSVFDATGRTVNRSTSFNVYPRNYYLGIKSPQYYYDSDQQITLKIAAVDPDDKDLQGFPAQVELVRYEWRTVLRDNGSGYFRYVSEQKEIIEKAKSDITLGGGAKDYSFKVPRSGRYELRVYKKGSRDYVKQRFYAYGYHSSTASSFEVDKEGRVEMVFEKENYQVGDKAKVLFTTPFSGKMLVTVEQDQVLSYEYIQVENNAAEYEFELTEAHMPNVFISATLIRPHKMNAGTPFLVGHGYANLTVEKAGNRLPLEISAPDKVKPNTTQEIVIKSNSEEDIHVTLALVDEGILQIKNFKTPDPYGYMYASRKLKVDAYDIYGQLLPELAEQSASPAGGDDSGRERRINPITAQRFKLLAYWSGIRKTNSNGEVRIKVPLPQFNGEARLMAVAWSGPRFGSAEKAMKITDDVVMLPAIPRVISVGDTAFLPVTLMNTTDKAGNVSVNLGLQGPLEAEGKDNQSVKIGPRESKVVNFRIRAKREVGIAKITLQTSGLDKVKQETEIAVRPVSPLIPSEDAGSITAGQNVNLNVPRDYLTQSQLTSVMVSKFPGIKLTGHLKYLVGYPHGCVEQTTSKAFPQIYFADLAKSISGTKFYNGDPVYFVNEAIAKLQSMQLSDGSIAYWPGGNYSNAWGTIYATHFLLESKKAGYNVSDYTLNRALSWIGEHVKENQTYSYNYWRNNSWVSETRARKEAFYGLYVLALGGKGDISTMNYFRARPHLITTDSRYLLAGSYALMNDWTSYHDVLPDNFSAEKPQRTSGGSFDSEVRANAIMLNVLLDVEPSNSQIPYLVKHVAGLANNAWSTQDRCWTFLALGKAARKNANATVNVDLMANGKKVFTFNENNSTYDGPELNGANLSLKSNGQGEVYWFWGSEGIKKDIEANYQPVDRNLKVRRTYLDRTGAIIGNNTVNQGDLIVCRITIQGGERSVENVAISDLVPAGFEIENPRLNTSTSLSWVSNTLGYDYMDVRDDRLLLFTDISRNQSATFHYMLRAVTAGEFVLPPIGAEAMYDPEFRSLNGLGRVQIIPKSSTGI